MCVAILRTHLCQATHLKNVHNMNAAARHDLMGSGALPKMTDIEMQHVEACEDEKAFTCKVCAKQMSKRSALLHFVGRKHQLPKDTVEKWIVVVDGRALHKKRLHKVKLGAVLQHHKVTHVPDSDEEVATIARTLPVPLSWRCAQRRRLRQKSKREALYVR